MKIVYTDENKRLKDFGEIMSSYEFTSFVNNNLSKFSAYDYGMVRVKPHRFKLVLNEFLKDRGFLIGDKTEHAHGIGNNNMIYVQDLKSGEYIGALNLNTDMFSGMYCYATDIHKKRVSSTYLISPQKVTLEHNVSVDWSKYQFGKEELALNVIEDAIKAGVLREGRSGGVLVYKEFNDGSEGWQEVSKDFAAKDLVKQDKVKTLSDAIEKAKQLPELSLDEQKTLYGQAYGDNGEIFLNRSSIDIWCDEKNYTVEECISAYELKTICSDLGLNLDALEIEAKQELSEEKASLEAQINASASQVCENKDSNNIDRSVER